MVRPGQCKNLAVRGIPCKTAGKRSPRRAACEDGCRIRPDVQNLTRNYFLCTRSYGTKFSNKQINFHVATHYPIEQMTAQSPNRVEVTLKIGDLTATLAGPEQFVREEIERLARVMSGVQAGQTAGESVPSAENNASSFPERDLLQQKSPHGHAETVAVLAFCLTQQGFSEFTAEHLWKAYFRADRRPPKSAAQAARDAKNKYDFLESGSASGTFRLSAHGERFVRFDLPRNTER